MIYLDNAATTPMCEEARREMAPFLEARFGNPSAQHALGRDARAAVGKARRQVAAAICCEPGEVYFTSGGTESDNWALLGAAFANRDKGRHLISSAVEHPAVIKSLEWLKRQGFEVTLLPVDPMGRVNPEQVRAAIRTDTILVSIMAANNEIGTLQPVAEIGRAARERGILFHTDAVQAVGAIPVDVMAWQADLLSLSAHKFHGPKGVGALFIRKGARVDAMIHGGSQESGRRAGTENVAGIAGLGAAIRKAAERQQENAQRITGLREKLLSGVMEQIAGVTLNGDPALRLPNNLHLSIFGVEDEPLLLRLDLAGLAASSGSACASGSPEFSHVLRAIGKNPGSAGGSLRLTLSEMTTEEDVEEALRIIPQVVRSMREVSP